jgi:O-antigen ligase
VLTRLDPAERLIPVAFGLTAAVVGLMAGLDPKFAVAGSLGIAFMLLALANLSAGLIAFTLVVFLELAPAIGGPALSFTKLAGGVLAFSFLATLVDRKRSDDLFWSRFPGMFGALMLFLAWNVASYFWAEDPGRVKGQAVILILNIALFVIVLEAVKTERHVRGVLSAFVFGGAVAATYGVIAQPNASQFAYSADSSSGLGRIAGTVGDPNVLASLLVVGLILALALAATGKRDPIQRGMFLFAALLCAAGIFLTGSRGGLVALGGGLIAAILMTPRNRIVVAIAAVAIAGSAFTYYVAIAPEAAVQRLSTADGGSGRTDIWKVGWRIVEDKPTIGVGAGNFQVSSIHYLLAKPGAIESDSYVVDKPAVAHNSYLQMLAELGVIGLALFLAVLISAIACAFKAARVFARLGRTSMEVMSTAVAVALLSLLAADFFVSEGLSKQLWLLLAMGPAMLAMARDEAAGTVRT